MARRRGQTSTSSQPRTRAGAVALASTKHIYGVLVLGTVVVLLGLLLYLWPRMRLVELGYQYNALQARHLQALQRQKELQVELASLRRLTRIEQLAVEKLGMRTPQLSQVIYLRTDPDRQGSGSPP
jgi:cell division protein FtsL